MGVDSPIELQPLGEGAALLRVRGELDLGNAVDFRESLLAVLARAESAVVIDLRECSFIDSVSIGVLLSGRRSLESAPAVGPPLAVVATGMVARTLRLTGADMVIPVCPTPEDALTAVAR